MKKHLLFIFAAIFLPMGIDAQTKLVFDQESGLEYLDDGDGKLYIDVGSSAITTINGIPSNTYFVSDGGLRSNWRQNAPYPELKNQAKWYKEDLDKITEWNISNKQPKEYKGIEYFRNLERLTIPAQMSDMSNRYLTKVDLSKNTKLNYLYFTRYHEGGLEYLDISNTQLTSLDNTSLPSGAYSTLKTFKATNSKLTALNLRDNPNPYYALENIDLSGSEDLAELKLPEWYSSRKLSSINLAGCKLLGNYFTEDNPLDITDQTPKDYSSLYFFNFSNTGLHFPTTLKIWNVDNTDIIVDTDYLPNTDIDLTEHINLKTLTCHNITMLDVSTVVSLEKLTIKDDPDLDDLDLRLPPSGSQLKTLDINECLNIKDLQAPNCTNLTQIIFPYGGYYTSLGYCRNQLRKVNLSGCTALTALYINNIKSVTNYGKPSEPVPAGNIIIDNDYQEAYINLEELNAEGCSELKAIFCFSTLLKKLNLKDCTKLTTISMSQGRLISDSINLENCTAIEELTFYRHQLESLDFLPLSENLSRFNLNGGRYDRTYYGTEEGYFVNTNRIRQIDMTTIPQKVELFMVRHNLLESLDIENFPSIRQIEINNNLLWAADLKGLYGIQLNENFKPSNFNLGPQRPLGDLKVLKGNKDDGSEDKVIMEIPQDQYNIFKSDQLIAGSVKFNGGSALSQEIIDDGTKKYFVLAQNIKKDLNMYGKVNGFSYKYDTQAMSDETKVINCYKNPRTYSPAELVNTFEELRKMDIEVTTYPYIMYINPLSKSGPGVNYYSGTICLDYHSIVPKGTTVYIATSIKKDSVTIGGTAEVADQLHLEPVGSEGDIIPAGTALYVRSDTKAGLYAFDKAWKAKYIGWDGDYPKPKGHKTDTLVYIAELTPEDSIRLQEKQDYIASLGKNLLKGVPKGGMTVKAKTILTLGREYNKGEWTIGFWPYGGTFIDEHRCYIPGSYVINNENGGKGLVFNFDNTSTTGISNINNRDDANKADTWYTLQGAKLHQKPTQQGVYIHNGKKEIIK